MERQLQFSVPNCYNIDYNIVITVYELFCFLIGRNTRRISAHIWRVAKTRWRHNESFLNKKLANFRFEKDHIQRKIPPNIFYSFANIFLSIENSLKSNISQELMPKWQRKKTCFLKYELFEKGLIEKQ